MLQRIASQIYREIPKEERNMQLFRSIVGKAKVLLAEGKEKEIVIEILMNELFPKRKFKTSKLVIKKKSGERAYITKTGRLIWKDIDPSNSTKETLMTSGIWQLPLNSENCLVKLE